MDFLKKFNIKELARFCVGGGSAVVVDYVVYIILSKYMNVSVAKTISYVTGAAVGFVINKLWTFESKQFSVVEIVKYIVLYAFSAAMNTLTNRLVLSIITMKTIAFVFATGVSTVINFLGQKFFVFRKN